MAVFLIVLYLLFITPVGLGAAAAVGFGGRPEGAAAVSLWGVRLQINAAIVRDGQGQCRLITTFRQKPRQALLGKKPAKLTRFLRVLRSAEDTPKLLRRIIRLRDFSLHADVAVQDAASVALLTALLRMADAFFGQAVHITANPVFSGRGGLRARCIVETRLGTLWTAALLGSGRLLLRRKKEAGAWNTRLET